ncbi:UDP-galactose/UDP-glucose transporter 7, partial [Hyalella azteca]|uniref:UDP-galactose/UDP-glucose transporter 7 n=1 Tax=Hyalella azteca TaxID=294128 RepID=A0A8B7P3V5_HYAAZ
MVWRALSAGVDDPRWREPAAAVFYGVTSTALAFINKAVLSSYDFNLPFLIMTLQMVLTVSSLWVLTRWGVVSLPPYTLAAGWSFKWPSLFCAMHGVLSLYALSGLNIPMYGTLKRCTPLVNLLLSVVLLKKGVPSCLLTSSILLITAGCIIAAVGDLAYDAYAYTLGMMSVLAQGLYQSLVQYHAEQQKMSSSRILQLNSYNTLWPMVFFSVVVGEPRQALNSPHWR